MLSVEENARLTEVGPDSAMGKLLRYYWHPVCAAVDLAASPYRTLEVKVLDEELVVYRDRRGELGIVQRSCAHRRANLAYGVVEDDGIRCQYHGWKYDRTGRCVEQPFDDAALPDQRFRDKCSIRAYPIQELAGLIFVYMGPAPAPLLPRWEPLIWENAVRDIAISYLPCSWLQCQENSLDTVHREWLHGYADSYYRQIAAGNPDARGKRRPRIQSLGFDPFQYGILKRRLHVGQNEACDEWQIGHPMMFPNMLLVGNPYDTTLQFRVPIDRTHTLHVSLYTWRAAPGAECPVQADVPARVVPLTDDENRFLVDRTFNQDYMCWISQGEVAERNLERLGKSDEGIILFRKMLQGQLQLVDSQREPTINILRDPATNRCIELPLERDMRRPLASDGAESYAAWLSYQPKEAGYSRDADKIAAVRRTWQTLPLEEPVAQLVGAATTA